MGSSEEAVRHFRHEKLHGTLPLAHCLWGICCPTGKVQAANTDWDTWLREGHLGFPYRELPGIGPDPSCPRAAHYLVLPFPSAFVPLSFLDPLCTFLSQEVLHFSRRRGVTLPAGWPHSALGGPAASQEGMHQHWNLVLQLPAKCPNHWTTWKYQRAYCWICFKERSSHDFVLRHCMHIGEQIESSGDLGKEES